MTNTVGTDNQIKDALSAARVFFDDFKAEKVFVAKRATRLGVSMGEWQSADGSPIQQVSGENLVDLEVALRAMLGG